MKKEYDFSKAQQGKFFRPIEELEIPVYLDKEVKTFYCQKALDKHLDLGQVINTILRKEMEILREVGA